MYFPIRSIGYGNFSVDYVEQHIHNMHDTENILQLLEYNKHRYGNDYYWTIELSIHSGIPSFRHNENESIDRAFKIHIPDVVISDIKNGDAKLAIDYSLEGYTDIDWDFLFDALPKFSKNDMIFLTSVYNTEQLEKDSGIKCYYTNRWERMFFQRFEPGSNHMIIDDDAGWRYFKKNIQRIQSKVIRPHAFTTYNRRPRDHRLALLGSLEKENLLKNSIYSWGGDFERNLDHHNMSMHVNRKYFNSDIEDDMYHTLINISKKIVEHDVTFDLGNPAWITNWKHIFNTNFQLIVETYARDTKDETFLSEKSFKPFSSGQPFVLWGDIGTVQAIREHGYDVYDKWIDHSYDNISNGAKRLKAVTEEVKRLTSISNEEWAEILYDMLPTIKSNYQNLSGCYNKSFQSRINSGQKNFLDNITNHAILIK